MAACRVRSSGQDGYRDRFREVPGTFRRFVTSSIFCQKQICCRHPLSICFFSKWSFSRFRPHASLLFPHMSQYAVPISCVWISVSPRPNQTSPGRQTFLSLGSLTWTGGWAARPQRGRRRAFQEPGRKVPGTLFRICCVSSALSTEKLRVFGKSGFRILFYDEDYHCFLFLGT